MCRVSIHPRFDRTRVPRDVLERNEENVPESKKQSPARRGKRNNPQSRENSIVWIASFEQRQRATCVVAARLPTYRHCIKYSPKDGEQEYRPEMVEEQPIGHEVAGVQDDRRQHVQEERVGRQRRHVDHARLEQQQADNHADDDQQAGLWEDLVEFGRHVEAYRDKRRR